MSQRFLLKQFEVMEVYNTDRYTVLHHTLCLHTLKMSPTATDIYVVVLLRALYPRAWALEPSDELFLILVRL
jgi:hypothetical protein